MGKRRENVRFKRLYKDKKYLSSTAPAMAERNLLISILCYAISDALRKPKFNGKRRYDRHITRDAKSFFASDNCRQYCDALDWNYQKLLDFVEKASSDTDEGKKLRSQFFKFWNFDHGDKRTTKVKVPKQLDLFKQ